MGDHNTADYIIFATGKKVDEIFTLEVLYRVLFRSEKDGRESVAHALRADETPDASAERPIDACSRSSLTVYPTDTVVFGGVKPPY